MSASHRLSMHPKDKEQAAEIPPAISDLHCRRPLNPSSSSPAGSQ
jgi:hypothetical protein